MSDYKKQLMTESRFNRIKSAINENPSSNKTACAYWKISESTIGRIRKCKNFNEYKNIVESYVNHAKKIVVTIPERIVTQGGYKEVSPNPPPAPKNGGHWGTSIPTAQGSAGKKQESLFSPEKPTPVDPVNFNNKLNTLINLITIQNQLLTRIADKKLSLF